MNDPGAVLKAVCDEVIADLDLQPGKGVTHCNEGARRVAHALGCEEFDAKDLLADDMCALMEDNESGRWMKVSGSDATIHALGGGLAFAAMSSHQLGEAHGHIAAIYPTAMEHSGSLGRDVPMCANVGKQDREEKVSEAFPVVLGEPAYYTWS